MADVENQVKENVPGRFYVDDQCIDCNMCRSLAPDFFAGTKNGGTYVKKQPSKPEDFELCGEALESCPVDAIGENDEEENF